MAVCPFFPRSCCFATAGFLSGLLVFWGGVGSVFRLAVLLWRSYSDVVEQL